MRVFLWIVLIVCIIAAGIFGYLLFSEIIVDRQSQSFFDNMASAIETRPREWAHNSDVSDTNGDDGNTAVFLPGEVNNWVPFLDFDALNEQYRGVVGWIELPDSPINFPVMQHASNNTFFLNHLPDGTMNRSGSIYLDYRNESDFSDESVLIFGHHFTRTDAMFSYLRNYRHQVFFDENPVIYLYTPYADYALMVFAVTLAHAVRDHPPLQFADDAAFTEYIRTIRSRSLIQSDVDVNPGDRIVSLVTCQLDFAEARLLVFGKFVRLGGMDIITTEP